MRAAVYHQYGSPGNLELQDVETPAPKNDEILIRVRAASLNWLDWHFLTGTPFMARLMAGLLKPKHRILGIDVAGMVVALGGDAKRFGSGDEVFGSCRGSFAEYVCASVDEVQLKPTNLSFEQAAAVTAAASTALRALRDAGQIRAGQRVLVNGASGGVGTFAVQIAKAFAADVTGVCSTGNLDLVRSIGADQVIDYTQEDFTQAGQVYDLIFDTVAKRSFPECRRALGPDGIYVTTQFSPVLAFAGLWTTVTGDKKMVALSPKPPSEEDQAFMKQLLEEEHVTPVIDRCYPLSDAPEAFRYLGKGHARGKVIITV